MALALATQVVTSFPLKASQTPTNGSRLSASTSSVVSPASSSSSNLSTGLSATNLSANTAHVSASSNASISPNPVPQRSSPSSSSTSYQYQTPSANVSETPSTSAVARPTPHGINQLITADFSPKSTDVIELVNTASKEVPQFNLKQGAISVQGLLGQGKNPSLSLVSQDASQDNIESSVKTVEEEVKPSVADVFASIYGTDADKPQITEPERAVAEDVKNSEPVQQQEERAQRQQAITEQERASATQTAQIEAAEVAKLSKRDAEVKSHEQAHASVGGSYAQSPSFSYEKGPDGRRYAVDGEVQIDVSVVNGDAQATLNKMMKVYAAAMAPVQPSMADIRVAADALQKMNAARDELAIERQQGVIKLDDANHILGLGRKLQESEQEESRSQLEPFEKKTAEPKTNAIGSGTINTANATLAYAGDNSRTYGRDEDSLNVNPVAVSQAQVDFYV